LWAPKKKDANGREENSDGAGNYRKQPELRICGNLRVLWIIWVKEDAYMVADGETRRIASRVRINRNQLRRGGFEGERRYVVDGAVFISASSKFGDYPVRLRGTMDKMGSMQRGSDRYHDEDWTNDE
jgi:hypothetical protein